MKRLQSNRVLGMVMGLLSTVAVGCNSDVQSVDTKNGSGSGGAQTGGAGGAAGSGGTSASGGQVGTGGAPGTGGVATGSGGAAATGGKVGSGGVSGEGGRVQGSGGAAPANDASVDSARRADGGNPPSTDGRMPMGGTSSGGTGAGGTTGAGGSTGPVTLPAKFVGNIDTRGSIRSDFSKYWNQFSPENAGKWGSVQGSSQSSFNWNSLDAMYKYCGDNKILFKQHNFVWGAQQPSWTDSLSTSNGPGAIQAWMKAFCTRYPDTKIIDVVNEPPPHTTPKYANAIGGGTNSTWDWIANAFKWAREACPNALLVLNDYNNVELSGDVQHTIDIVTAIKKAGAPIDAVGCQTHGAANLPATTLKTNVDKIASGTGLPVYITEYDIAQADDAKQQKVYQDHFTMFMSNNNIKGVTIWGYLVGATWVNNTGILNTDGSMRPAMTWLMGFLGR
jgi:endo-1,4-beta-xylanase